MKRLVEKVSANEVSVEADVSWLVDLLYTLGYEIRPEAVYRVWGAFCEDEWATSWSTPAGWFDAANTDFLQVFLDRCDVVDDAP